MNSSTFPTDGPPEPGFHKAVLQHSEDLAVVVDRDGTIRYASPAIASLLGYAPEEWIGGNAFDQLHPGDRDAGVKQFEAVLEAPGRVEAGEYRVRHRDGGWRVLQATGKNLLDHPVIGGLLVNIRDVTSMRAAQAELSRTRELLQEVVDHAPVVFWKVDPDGIFQLSEGRGLEAIGLEPGQVVGQSIFDVYAETPEDLELVRRALDGEAVEARVELAGRVYDTRIRPLYSDGQLAGAVGVALDVTDAARQASRAEFQARLLQHVGEAVIVTGAEGRVIYWNAAAEEMYGWTREEALGRSVTKLTIPEPAHEEASAIIEMLRSGERWAGEYTVQRKDGTVFPAHVSNVPLMEDGELEAIIGVSVDLTEEKRLESQLRQAQKMEAVGQLAGGIAHDFNNLLTTIGGYAALAADRTADDDVAADLMEVLRAADRARGLAGKLLAFSRRQTGRLEPLDPNVAVRRSLPVLKRVVGDHVRVELELADRPWRVMADPALIEQTLVNLALNARDAMPSGGTFTLATDRVTLDASRIDALDLGVEPGEYMRLVAEDTGTGIEPDLHERIFEPFFTTKEVGKGSGLGLAMVFGAVKQAGGGIVLRSAPGAGARFALYLPRVEPAEPAARAASGGPDTPSDRTTVLVVEDETAVLALARRVLEREGYRVLAAGSGPEARRILEEEPEVDLVVSDVIMPKQSGPELIQGLRRTHPGIRSLFMSGYAADELEIRGLSREKENFLPKPFAPEDLVAAVRDALDD